MCGQLFSVSYCCEICFVHTSTQRFSPLFKKARLPWGEIISPFLILQQFMPSRLWVISNLLEWETDTAPLSHFTTATGHPSNLFCYSVWYNVWSHWTYLTWFKYWNVYTHSCMYPFITVGRVITNYAPWKRFDTVFLAQKSQKMKQSFQFSTFRASLVNL